MVVSCAASPSPFTFLRITPTCKNPWVAAGTFGYRPLGISGACLGVTTILGTVLSPDPVTGCTRDPALTCPPTYPQFVNQCTVITWNNLGPTEVPLVDSTVLVTVNLACPGSGGQPLVNYGVTPYDVVNQFGCCQNGLSGPYTTLDPACLTAIGPDNSGCTAILKCPYNPTPTPTPVVPDVDGIIQFIAQICGSNTNVSQSASVAAPYGVYSFRIQRPTFPLSLDGSGYNVLQNTCFNSNPWASFFQSNVNPIVGYGNFDPLTFTIGACFNNGLQGPCSQLVTLVYVGAICQTAAPLCVEQPDGGITLANKNVCQVTSPSFSAYYYPYYYANIKFSITDASGNPRRCKSKFAVNCFLSVTPATVADAAQFCVYFGQTRNCGGLNQIIVNNIVDLACLLYGGTVYIITSAKTLYSLV